MARQKNDGKGRLGGRVKGTPNKDKPLKALLRSHSLEYFTPSIEEVDDDGKPTGKMISQFDLDQTLMAAKDRASLEVALLSYHTPKMQATTVDVALADQEATLEERLAALCEDFD